jgi:hypothetical protein
MNNELERMRKEGVMEFMWRVYGNLMSWLRFVPAAHPIEKVSLFEPTYNSKLAYII